MNDLAKNNARKPRADAERNRLRLLAVAKQAFANDGPDVSLEEIARVAKVGIGTLYRHFPTRDTLIDQVYRNEVEQLAEAASCLANTHPPVEALRQWLFVFVDYLAAKRIISAALRSTARDTDALYAASSELLFGAINDLIERATKSGNISLGMDPIEILRAIASVANVSDENAKRLSDLLIAGMLVR